MSDIICAKCSEPWDSYGLDHGDTTKEEARKIRKGQGCPSCAFGTRCTICYGKGWYTPEGWDPELVEVKCSRCEGTGKFIPEKEGGHLFEALNSLVESTDEDPLDLILGFEIGGNEGGG